MRLSESSKVYRIYGKCTTFCIPFSQLNSVGALATHRVFFEFKHWVIYVHVFCLIHKAFEIWCIEKIFHKWADLKDKSVTNKVLCNGSIWISCSTYSQIIFLDKFKPVSKFMFFDRITNHLMRLKPSYNPLLDNCEHFKKTFWKWLVSTV